MVDKLHVYTRRCIWVIVDDRNWMSARSFHDAVRVGVFARRVTSASPLVPNKTCTYMYIHTGLRTYIYNKLYR